MYCEHFQCKYFSKTECLQCTLEECNFELNNEEK